MPVAMLVRRMKIFTAAARVAGQGRAGKRRGDYDGCDTRKESPDPCHRRNGEGDGSWLGDLRSGAERGGNCDITETGKTVVKHGVTIIGPVNLASTVPYHASMMYSRNITLFLRTL
jgi:hypothetical protein